MATTDRSPDYDDSTDEALRPPPAAASRPAPVLEPNEARGGVTHQNVRFVLGVGIVVVIVLFVIVYFAYFGGGAPTTIAPPAAG